jgi:hypothetical protein
LNTPAAGGTFYVHAVILKEGQVVYDGRMHELVGQRDLLQDNSIDQSQITQLATRLVGGERPPTPLTVNDFLVALPGLTEN